MKNYFVVLINSVDQYYGTRIMSGKSPAEALQYCLDDPEFEGFYGYAMDAGDLRLAAKSLTEEPVVPLPIKTEY